MGRLGRAVEVVGARLGGCVVNVVGEGAVGHSLAEGEDGRPRVEAVGAPRVGALWALGGGGLGAVGPCVR